VSGFDAGLLTARFLSGIRASKRVYARDLQNYLDDHGHRVTLRSCQRYLAKAERYMVTGRVSK